MDTKKICKETVTFIFRVTTSCLHPQVSSNQHRCLMGDGCIKIKSMHTRFKSVLFVAPICRMHVASYELCLTIVFSELDSNNKEQFQRLESDMLSSRGQREDDSTQHTVLKKSGTKKRRRTAPFPQPSCWPAIEWRRGTNARLRRGKKKTLREHIMQSDSFWEPHPTSVRLPDTHNTNPICHSLISFFFYVRCWTGPCQLCTIFSFVLRDNRGIQIVPTRPSLSEGVNDGRKKGDFFPLNSSCH